MTGALNAPVQLLSNHVLKRIPNVVLMFRSLPIAMAFFAICLTALPLPLLFFLISFDRIGRYLFNLIKRLPVFVLVFCCFC